MTMVTHSPKTSEWSQLKPPVDPVERIAIALERIAAALDPDPKVEAWIDNSASTDPHAPAIVKLPVHKTKKK
jgi:hypothetical protein